MMGATPVTRTRSSLRPASIAERLEKTPSCLREAWDTTANGLNADVTCMGDTSPKNQHKLHEQQQEKHVEKDHKKLENAVHQHHPDRPSTPEEDLALKKQEEEADASVEKTE